MIYFSKMLINLKKNEYDVIVNLPDTVKLNTKLYV